MTPGRYSLYATGTIFAVIIDILLFIMKTGILFALAALLAAFPVLADSELTVRNVETGDSMTLTVPDGLHIHESNAAWPDSVPYLIEHARLAEPWAYKALGDCYRYGTGGVKKCLFNAICYYMAAGIDPEDMVRHTSEENPDDELVRLLTTLKKVVRFAERGQGDSIPAYIECANLPERPWARTIREFSGLDLSDEGSERILSLVNEDSDGDQFLVAFVLKSGLFHKEGEFRPLDKSLALARKVPMMYNFVGTEYLKDYHDYNSKDALIAALDCFRKADEAGLLDPYYLERMETTSTAAGVDLTEYFTEDDLNRLRYLKSRRDKEFESKIAAQESAVEEIVVVEGDDDPAARMETE